jgi:hypothetical protein
MKNPENTNENLAPNRGENKQNQHNDFEMKKIRMTHELL